MRKYLISILLILASLSGRAQFYSNGSDPGGLRWYSMQTAHYKFIYPEGLDSLARVYGRYMEQFRPALAHTSGYVPGGKYRRPTPVVLHAYSGVSNGSVAWAPKRMEFYTLPDPYDPWPISWEKSLSIHESRHLAQMMAGYEGWFRPLGWFLGEMIPGAFAGLFPGPHLLEGDAVVAETALTATGRGRNGDFLNYYHIAFDEGDWRDWYKWRYGSFKRYAPNHYALGYMTVAGARAFYDDPQFIADYFHTAARHPLRLFQLKKTLRRDTGEETLRGSGRAIFEQFHARWIAEAEERKPFISSQVVTPVSAWFTEYDGGVAAGEDIYIIAHGKLTPHSLVRIRGGEVKTLQPFGADTSPLAWDPVTRRLYWSETVGDLRWEEAGTSRIRYMAVDEERVRFHDLTTRGRYYNPVPSPDGTRLAALSYPYTGGTRLVVLDATDGRELSCVQAPDGQQFVQVVWQGETAFVVSVTSDEGASLVRVEDGLLTPLLEPMPVSITGLRAQGDKLIFQSDRTGVNEMYAFDPEHGELTQLTATRYGAGDGFYMGNDLYFTSLSLNGRYLYRAEDLALRGVSWADYHRDPVAEKLSAQEHDAVLADPDTVHFSAPVRYRKVPHIFNVHSWVLPLYVNVDNVQQLTSDIVNNQVKLGATAIFQNVLGTASGTLGYSWGAAPEGGRRHAGHLTLKYNGLFPVFELKANVGDRAAIQYVRRTYKDSDMQVELVGFGYMKKTAFDVSLQAYVPFNLSKGGWSAGIVPRISYFISNDLYDKSEVDMTSEGNFGGEATSRFTGYTEGRNVPMQQMTASLSAYRVQRSAPSLNYPRWGVGGELGWRMRLGLSDLYSSGIYGYLYGYVPGFTQTQGARLAVLYQHLFDQGQLFFENTVNTAPRGLSGTSLQAYLSSSTNQMRLTADYAIPLYFGDISLFSPVVYITHFLLRPHLDYSFFSRERSFDSGLLSAGSDVVAKVENFLWLPYGGEIGFTLDYNGGPSFSTLQAEGVLESRNHLYAGMIFNMSF